MAHRVKIIRDEAGLAELEEPWTGLLIKCGWANVFSSFQWNVAWWHHFKRDHTLHVVTIWDDAGELMAVAPLMLTRSGPVRRLEFIGTGLSDSGDVLLHPDLSAHACATLFTYLGANRHRWDLGDWSEVPARSP